MPTPKIIRAAIPGDFESRRMAAVPELGKDSLNVSRLLSFVTNILAELDRTSRPDPRSAPDPPRIMRAIRSALATSAPSASNITPPERSTPTQDVGAATQMDGTV